MMKQSSRQILAEAARNFVVHGLGSPEMEAVIDRVLVETKRENLRACPVRARLVVWLVISMALHRNCSIANIFERLVGFLRDHETRFRRNLVTPEAVYHARARLGVLPVKNIFRELVKLNPVVPTYKGLRVMAIDGSEFTVPDTPMNNDLFGRHENQRSSAAFPHVQGVFLQDVAAHRILECCFLPCNKSEKSAMRFLIKNLGSGDLLMTDRGLVSFPLLNEYVKKDLRFLVRLTTSWKPEFYKALGPGDNLMIFRANRSIRYKLPIGERNKELVLRVIECRVNGGELIRLVTDLTDSEHYPALELVELYGSRWECELLFKEMKSQLLTQTGGKQPTHFRSKSPLGVLQEAWGAALAHLLVRNLMAEAAAAARVTPLELSVATTLEELQISLPGLQMPCTAKCRQRKRDRLIQNIADCRIDRPRRKRQYQRAVKKNGSKFPVMRARAAPSSLVSWTVTFIVRRLL